MKVSVSAWLRLSLTSFLLLASSISISSANDQVYDVDGNPVTNECSYFMVQTDPDKDEWLQGISITNDDVFPAPIVRTSGSSLSFGLPVNFNLSSNSHSDQSHQQPLISTDTPFFARIIALPWYVEKQEIQKGKFMGFVMTNIKDDKADTFVLKSNKLASSQKYTYSLALFQQGKDSSEIRIFLSSNGLRRLVSTTQGEGDALFFRLFKIQCHGPKPNTLVPYSKSS